MNRDTHISVGKYAITWIYEYLSKIYLYILNKTLNQKYEFLIDFTLLSLKYGIWVRRFCHFCFSKIDPNSSMARANPKKLLYIGQKDMSSFEMLSSSHWA